MCNGLVKGTIKHKHTRSFKTCRVIARGVTHLRLQAKERTQKSREASHNCFWTETSNN